MFSNRVINFSLVALPVLLLASCGGGEPQNTQAPAPQAQTAQDKTTEFCTKLARFNTSVATLKSMSPSSTVGDFKQAQKQVRVAYNDVKSAAGAVENAKTADLDKAYQELDNAVRSVPDTATLKQAAASVTPKISAVQAAEKQMKTGVSCP